MENHIVDTENERKKKTTKKLADKFPRELWALIFIRLSARELVEFRLVNKDWCSIISCPHFVSTYSQYQTFVPSGKRKLVISDRIFSFAHSFKKVDSLPFRSSKKLNFISSCHGLFLFLSQIWEMKEGNFFFRHQFTIWNPSLNVACEIPISTSPSLPDKNLKFILGFGCAHKNTYKVLRIGCRCSPKRRALMVYEIYEVRSGVWRTVDDELPISSFEMGQSLHFLKGCLHGVGYGKMKRDEIYERKLIVFDLTEEAFKDYDMPGMEFPKIGQSPVAEEAYLLMHEDKIAMAQVTLERSADDVYMDHTCSIWVMEEYGHWVKKFILNLSASDNISRPIHLWESDHILFCRNGKVSSYNIQSAVVETVVQHSTEDDLYVGSYVENLVLHNGEGKWCLNCPDCRHDRANIDEVEDAKKPKP